MFPVFFVIGSVLELPTSLPVIRLDPIGEDESRQHLFTKNKHFLPDHQTGTSLMASLDIPHLKWGLDMLLVPTPTLHVQSLSKTTRTCENLVVGTGW